MKKILTVEDFIDYCDLIRQEPATEEPCLVLCAGTGGQASGSNDVMRLIKRYIIEQNLHDKIFLRITGCLGFCEMDPFLIVEPGHHLYPRISLTDIPEIIDATIEGKVINKWLYKEPENLHCFTAQQQIPFFKHQTRTILGYNQELDPIRIHHYIAKGGYVALEKVVTNPDPEWIIEEIKKSELRGRGGAGFPAGKKWEMARKAGGQNTRKYIVCNADEGDPGAYMDRSLLEGNPHMILEGLIIAGIAIGATQGYIYVRSEYPLALKHTMIAIRQVRELGILGENIFGTGISFNIDIVRGAGAFVCGEETALIKSIEGQMGQPRQRPPYPVDEGINGCPTCINNVETLANVPVIIAEGAEKYARIGLPGNRGTKIFSLVGKIKNTGLVEVPLGTTLREIVYDIGGGPPGKAEIKAIQTGGPSGGCIPSSKFDLPIDFEHLKEAGSIMGSGGMIVMDENTCMVDIAKYFTHFLQEESCGKCSTCREGTQRMYEILNDITAGKGRPEDIETLRELGHVIRDVSMCGLGQTAANPMLSTLRYFMEEYTEHIVKKKCRAVVCKEIISSPCQYTCPIDTEVPVYVSLIAQKKYEDALRIIKKENPFASVLARVCHHPCENKCRAGETGEPVAIRDLKRFVTDYGIKHTLITRAEAPKNTNGKKVAVIGSGPAGLTCGFYLAKKGYEVTVFEKESVIGGMLALGIPEYRLPRDILKADLDYIRSVGLDIRTNTALGKDFTLDSLFTDGYKAVFLATGSHRSLRLNIDGEEVSGVYPGMQALSALNLGSNMGIGRKVGIIGGGNTAVDAARRVLRTESPEGVAAVDTARSALRTTEPDSVTIFYRRTMEEIPAYKEEIEGALKEGIQIEFLTAPKRIISQKGKLKACEFMRMKLGEPDESGRRRPVPIEGSEFIVELDTLIVSISESPDISCYEPEDFEFTKWDTLVNDPETCQTKRLGVFAGGDLVTGPNTVVDAAASGKLAATSIDQYLNGKEVKPEYTITRPSQYIEPVELTEAESDELFREGRPDMPVLSPEKRKYNLREVSLGLTDKQALREARRCLRCDLETREGQDYVKRLQEKNIPLSACK